MQTFEFVRSHLVDEEARYPLGSADCIVGAALCSAIRYEAREETKRQKDNKSARTDEELMAAVLGYLEKNWVAEMERAEHTIQARSIDLLDDRLSKSIAYSIQDSKLRERPVWFATWTGVLANTVWLLLGALIIIIALLLLGESPQDAMRNLLLPNG